MIKIDYRDARPIYEQVVDGIEGLALRGALPADTQLPSVRQLAMELSINPNTIQRAYGELERRGVIYAAKGREILYRTMQRAAFLKLNELGEQITALAGQALARGDRGAAVRLGKRKGESRT
ncbi:MAG: GntR family transcriptional regulator [Butyricicoccus sp.]